jgi:hypothetical protein
MKRAMMLWPHHAVWSVSHAPHSNIEILVCGRFDETVRLSMLACLATNMRTCAQVDKHKCEMKSTLLCPRAALFGSVQFSSVRFGSVRFGSVRFGSFGSAHLD